MKSAYLWIFSVLSFIAILLACAITQRPTPTTPDEGVPSEGKYYDDEDLFTLDTWEPRLIRPTRRRSYNSVVPSSITSASSDVIIEDATGEASVTYWNELPGTSVFSVRTNEENSNLIDIQLTGPPCVYGEVVQICENYCIIKPFEANAEYEQYLDGESIAARLLAAAPYCLVPTTSGAELLEDVAVGDIIRVVFGYNSAKAETAYPDVVVLSTVIAAYPFPDPTLLR